MHSFSNRTAQAGPISLHANAASLLLIHYTIGGIIAVLVDELAIVCCNFVLCVCRLAILIMHFISQDTAEKQPFG